MSRRLAAKLFGVYLLVVLGLTLGGFYHRGATINLIPFRMMEHDIHNGGWEFLVNFVGNVVVTMPIGWFLPVLLGPKNLGLKVGGFALVLSSLIEILQGLSGRRVADVDDVILNTLGALVGYGIWWIAERCVRRFRAASDFPTSGGCRATWEHQE